MHRRSGFSLVELLVSMAVIAILIALLLPAMTKARQQATSVQCKARLQQLGQAIAQYQNANNGKYPIAASLPNPIYLRDFLRPLPELLAPYLQTNQNMFRCPGDETYYMTEGSSYFYYEELAYRPLKSTFFYTVVKTPTLTPILWDGAVYHGGKVPRNWLFADLHVDQFIQDPRPRDESITAPIGP